MRTSVRRLWLLLLVAALNVPGFDARLRAEEPDYDILVYGATPGGISATVSAARHGRTVLLVEPTPRLGGLITNGLSHPDFRTFEGISGIYAEFNGRILKHYRDRYGADSQQVIDTFHGTHSEPEVALTIFRTMLAEQPTVTVLERSRLKRVEMSHGRRRIAAAEFQNADGNAFRATARIFIDATYEGDLLAAAGVPYRVGREARSEYGESLAPAESDRQVQGYNFRLTMTADPANRVLASPPLGYNRDDYTPLLELIASRQITSAFHVTDGGSNPKAIYKIHGIPLPNGKYDINDMSRGLVRLSLPQINGDWPDGDEAARRSIFENHLRDNVGMLYFLQNDADVPEAFRLAAREWGFCRDEFVENEHLPYQIYVREARRMIGVKVFTQNNVESHSENEARAVPASDAIAIGDYGPNCHGTAHEGPRFGGRHTGEFYHPCAPYQIPLGVLLPRECDNLLVPVACSSSHVGFCALRLEPIWIALGEASGVAAHVAIESDQPLSAIPVPRVQRLLHQQRAATIYTSDVGIDSRDFRAVQWWGTLGGFHGLNAPEGKYGQRGTNLRGQYYRAYPGHQVELDKPLSDDLRTHWLRLASEQGIDAQPLRSARTRGEFLRAAWRFSKAN